MRPLSLAIIAALTLTSCTGDDDTGEVALDPYDVTVGPYETQIRWTRYGIPHITADDHGGIGFGMGYVMAKDHICTLADQIVKTRSERAMYFGPGSGDANIESDFGWLHLDVRGKAERSFLELRPEAQARYVGYAAGYNRYLEEVGVDGLPEPCRGAEWVKPVSHIDMLAYAFSLVQWGSGYNLVRVIAQAQPPGADSGQGTATPIEPPPLDILEFVKEPGIGSNGWAIGSDMSASGKGMLLSNTHFPMVGERQWHESHITIPGVLDAYGASLIGMPVIAIGFNQHVAWTHTVSNTPRFVAYYHKLKTGDPTSYEYDGGYEQMEATTYTIEVQGAGSLERTLYKTRFGPVWNAPGVGWDPLKVMSYRDVNDANNGTIDTFWEVNEATTLAEVEAAHRDHQGIPWVHTMVADDQGNALYMDSAATPNIPDSAWAAYDAWLPTSIYALQYADQGLQVFDGGDPAFEWADDPRAAYPGVVPYDEVPRLLRTDFVNNSNQNYWMANPAEPLVGYPRIYGDTSSARTTRTRMNNRYLLGLGEDPERGEDGKFDLDELSTAAFSFRSSLAEMLKDDVVTRCRTAVLPITVSPDGIEATIDLTEACNVLEAWDGRGRTDSVGAVLWREMVSSGPINPEQFFDAGPLFAVGFDPSDPIGTPNTLAPAPAEGPDPILEGLAIAVARIERAGFAIDDPLGDVQIRRKADEEWATPGGQYYEGYIGIATYSGKGGDTTLFPAVPRGDVINRTSGLSTDGYVVTNGNSWVMTMEFTDSGPRANALMVYSQSEDPASPHFSDQTALYATQEFRPVPFTDAEIEADPQLTAQTLTLE